MKLIPIQFKEAKAFVNMLHRHHVAPHGHKFSIGITSENVRWVSEEFLSTWPEMKNVVGVAIVGRPVSRHLDDKRTLEVTRLCTDGTRNACSFLYAKCWEIVKEKGYAKLITYILQSENGSSLRAAGFKLTYESVGGTWNRNQRKRLDKHPTEPKHRYEISIDPNC